MKTKLYFLIFGVLSPVYLMAQWTSEATGFTTPHRGLFDISVVDANTVWGIAYDGSFNLTGVPEFTRSKNGGDQFTTGTFPAGYAWSNISAIDSNTAWVSVVKNTGLDGAIFKTIDGGATWNEQGAGTLFNSTSYVDFVHFWNANEGVTMGDPNSAEFEIYTTDDGGSIWTPVPVSAIPDPLTNEYGVWRNYCAVGNDIWFGTTKSRVYHSADKGLTWTVSDTGIPPGTINYIDFVFWNANEGIARQFDYGSHKNTYVRKTIDGGATWTPVTLSGTLFGSAYSGIAYVPGTTSTLVSTGMGANVSGSSYSNDGGNTWTLIDTLVDHYITRFINTTTGWSAGFNTSNVEGGIFKYTAEPLGVYNPENGKEIALNVYPNPSKGNIMIQLADAGRADIKISVVDLSGRRVLEDRYKDPGEFFLRSIDLSNLSGGVYVIRIVVDQAQFSRRIILATN